QKSSLKNSFPSHKSDANQTGSILSMTNPDVSRILKECSEDVISKLHFFRSSNGKPVATFLEGSALFKQNDHLERLIRFGLVQENPPAQSFTFYRERMEDFVFVKCDPEIARLVGKIKKLEGLQASLGPQSDAQRQEIAQYTFQIDLLKELKQIFAVMFRDSANIPSNERFADVDGFSRSAALKILSSYSAKDCSALPKPDMAQGERYFEMLQKRGFWVEFSPAPSYSITPLGMEVLAQFQNLHSGDRSPEEEEFEKIVQEMNQLDARKILKHPSTKPKS
nr:hypothetical protein [Candidatus Sigynarchaeota archaeon]